MAKSTPFDETDRKLIALLAVNARQTNVALAKQLGLTEGAVRRRIAQLTGDNYIRVVAIPGDRLRDPRLHVVCAFRVVPERLKALSEDLAKLPESRFVYEMLGSYNLSFVGMFENQQAFAEFQRERLAAMDGVLDTMTYLIVKTAKYDYTLGLEDE